MQIDEQQLTEQQLSLLAELLESHIEVNDSGAGNSEEIKKWALDICIRNHGWMLDIISTSGQLPALQVYNLEKLADGRPARINDNGEIEIAFKANGAKEALMGILKELGPDNATIGKQTTFTGDDGRKITDQDKIGHNETEGKKTGKRENSDTAIGRADLTIEPKIVTQPHSGNKRKSPGRRNTRNDVSRGMNLTPENRLKEMYFYFSLAEQQGSYSPGGFLRTLRLTSGMTQEKMAAKLGMQQSDYSHVELNRSPIKKWVVSKIVHDNILGFANISFRNKNGKEFYKSADEFRTKFINHCGYGDKLAVIIPGDREEILAELDETMKAYKRGENIRLPGLCMVMSYLMSAEKIGYYEAFWNNPRSENPDNLDVEKFFDDPSLKPEQIALLKSLPFRDGELSQNPDLIFIHAKRSAKTIGQFLEFFYQDRCSLSDIGKKAGVSKERIRQIQNSSYLEDLSIIISKKNPWGLPEESGEVKKEVIDRLHHL